MEKKAVSKSAVALVKGLVVRAVEELTGLRDEAISVIPFAKSGDFDYQSVFAPKIYPQLDKKDPGFKTKFPTQHDLVAEVQKKLQTEKRLVQKAEVIDQVYLLVLLGDEFLEETMNKYLKEGVHVGTDEHPQHIVVDFSSPNIAKEMHVGHLRSTILGESICRILEARGHKVKRVNHVGDWGTQFGMLIAHMQDTFPEYLAQKPNLKDLETFYKQSKQRFDTEPAFKDRAQKLVVKLQSGDKECLEAWQILCNVSRDFYNQIYKRLDITIEEFGESYYNPMIPGVLGMVKEKGLTTLDKGALCIYVPNKKVPLMVVKSDGGYNYDTTDLAAAWFRLTQLKADRVIYITDVGQYPHFELVFEAAKMAGWHAPPKTRLDHMGFGLVLGKDGQKIKTRKGETAKLMDLIDEAKDRAKKELQSREEGEVEEEAKPDAAKTHEAKDDKAKKGKKGEAAPKKGEDKAKPAVGEEGAKEEKPVQKKEEKKPKAQAEKTDKPAQKTDEKTQVKEPTHKAEKDAKPADSEAKEQDTEAHESAPPAEAEPEEDPTVKAAQELELRKKTQLNESEFDHAAEVLGVAAIKYFDMRQNRIQNYKFDYDLMLSQKGDTAVYLMYSYIRLCSILRKSGVKEEELRATPFKFTHPQERAIARHLAKFDEVIETVADQMNLNKLCEYLYQLSAKIAESYAAYKILKNDDTAQRLKLILISKDMMALCFKLLGIKTIDRI